MKLAVIGAGSMGSLFGGLLSTTGSEVWLIDIREDHVRAIREAGLSLETDQGTKLLQPRATTDPAAVGLVELLIVFVKASHTAEAMQAARPLIADDTLVLTLQNGLGNAETIAQTVGPERVILGVTYEGASTVGPGHVVHQVKGRTVIGPSVGAPGQRIKAAAELFRRAGLPTETSADMVHIVWSKAVINIAANALTALTGVTLAQIIEFPETSAVLRQTIDECLQVTRALGIRLEYDDDPQGHIQRHLRQVGHFKSSMLQDFEHARKSEIEALNGALVQHAQRLGLAAPVNELLTRLVQTIERRRGLNHLVR